MPPLAIGKIRRFVVGEGTVIVLMAVGLLGVVATILLLVRQASVAERKYSDLVARHEFISQISQGYLHGAIDSEAFHVLIEIFTEPIPTGAKPDALSIAGH